MPALTLYGISLVPHLEIADTFLSRAVGLLGRKTLPPGHGLLIRPCASIHTAFMRFPIDVAFLDRQGRVVKVIRNLPPWRMASGGRSACAVLETLGGGLPPLAEGAEVTLTAPA